MPGVGKHGSTQVDDGRNNWNLLVIKMNGTNRSGDGGEDTAIDYDPGTELRLGGRKKGEYYKWDEKNEKIK